MLTKWRLTDCLVWLRSQANLGVREADTGVTMSPMASHMASRSIHCTYHLCCTDQYAFSSSHDPPPALNNHNHAGDDVEDGELSVLVAKESLYAPQTDYFKRLESNDGDDRARQKAVSWILKVQAHYCFLPETALLATNYLDRFLSCTQVQQQKSWAIQLASVACLSLAAKMEERQVPLLFALQVGEAEHVFEPRTIQRMELLLLSALKWRMKAVTPLSYLQYGGHILDLEEQFHGEFIMRSSELALCTINETRLLKFMPSVIAAAIMLWVAREMEVINLNECEDCLLSRLKVGKGPLQCCYQLLQVSFGQAYVRKRKVCSSFSKPDSPHRVLDAAFSFSTEHSQKSSAKYTVSSPSSSPSVPNKRRITE